MVATGGRQADPTVRSELSCGGAVLLRGNPYSDGGGISLARGLGADVNFDNQGFYGHLVPAGVQPLSGLDYLALTQYHSSHCVLLDWAGTRFTDERAGDARNSTALATRGGRGVLLWSEQTQRAAALDPAPVDLLIDRYRYAADRGARVARVADMSAAIEQLRSWGITAKADAETLQEWTGSGPVFLADVVSAVTFTYGGLRADETAAVMEPNGRPIPDLFVAGADMSDIYHQGYAGGLSAALVTGRIAGRSAST